MGFFGFFGVFLLPFVANIPQHYFTQDLPKILKNIYANKVIIEIFGFTSLCSESKNRFFFPESKSTFGNWTKINVQNHFGEIVSRFFLKIAISNIINRLE